MLLTDTWNIMRYLILYSFQSWSLRICTYICLITKGFNRLLHRLRPQLKSLLRGFSRWNTNAIKCCRRAHAGYWHSSAAQWYYPSAFRCKHDNVSPPSPPVIVAGRIVAATIVIPPCHPPVLLTPLRVTRHKGSAWKSSNIEWSSRNPRYHFPVVMDCATTRRFRKGWRWWQSRIAEGTTRLSDDVLRRSTLSARTMRTPTTAWDSIRTNFGRPMKTKDSFGM